MKEIFIILLNLSLVFSDQAVTGEFQIYIFFYSAFIPSLFISVSFQLKVFLIFYLLLLLSCVL